jgi:rubrerythrin
VSVGAREAWAFRFRVEVEACLRFQSLARRVEAFDADSPVVALLREAASDERRHVELCRALAIELGATALVEPTALQQIAPSRLSERDRVLYEIISACCVTETESVATLTTLLSHPMRPDVEQTVRAIARDEVRHARLGWAHLAREASQRSVAHAGVWLPAMLEGTFVEGGGEGARELGVLEPSARRIVFAAALRDAVLPGVEHFGIEVSAAREWLERFTGRTAP